ncbi:MAG TPA: hypothetical protein VI759_08660 [Dehalococcoidia bacterium]|nr:hypothetical protein [Dehalococcoidia bacterium]
MATEARAITATTPMSGPPAGAFVVPEFEIIPLKGIPSVVAVIAGLTVAIAVNKLWALEFFHVVGGGLWTGIDLFVGLIIGPILGRLSTQARIEFLTRFMPKMVLIMPTLVIMTLASGWQLARYTGDIAASYPEHWWITASFMVVGVMSVIAIAILEPANIAVLFELKKPRPNGELMAKLTRRFIYTAGITGIMQLATLIIMVRLATN